MKETTRTYKRAARPLQRLIQAPRFNFQSSSLRNATIRYCAVDAHRTSSDSHGAIDLTAFNTDGFDVSGDGIHIHDSSVWNQVTPSVDQSVDQPVSSTTQCISSKVGQQ